MRGIDVIATTRRGTVARIDEKIKYRGGYINRDIDYPSVELSRLIRSGARRPGWFLDRETETDVWMFVTPWLYHGSSPEEITYNNIR